MRNFSIYSEIALYMFRTISPSIIRNLKTVHTASGIYHTSSGDCLLALLMMDGETVRNM